VTSSRRARSPAAEIDSQGRSTFLIGFQGWLRLGTLGVGANPARHRRSPSRNAGAGAVGAWLAPGGNMAKFIDIHTGMKGIDQKKLSDEHKKDTQVEASEGVKFLHVWADPESGKVFCLSEAPNKDAVLRVHKKAGHATEEIYEVPIEVE
jgi:hypothetical protein